MGFGDKVKKSLPGRAVAATARGVGITASHVQEGFKKGGVRGQVPVSSATRSTVAGRHRAFGTPGFYGQYEVKPQVVSDEERRRYFSTLQLGGSRKK